eukprot:CAMPEP_0198287282 /NCGR_PEP_ID=MMETSP1449-20131203/6160_1 /TAXON_ID=420275 /ORGANISM="Attheya septentrionalis, Strain CCMP2084" /LENGTH=588 /DNA_ID=CAMNT_0043985221 /DNA_START=44 /DNA_END=1810 /DNA_ORIENTATION=-
MEPLARPKKYVSLKQRTSSVDVRHDFSRQTWTSLLGLIKVREYFITVDHFSIWRRHLAWAKQDGKELRDHMTERFASNMVFMSLLLGANLSVLFNSSPITVQMRKDMRSQNHSSVEFWAGILIIISVVLTLMTLISTFTAWGMVSSVSDHNALCVLRSSIGQYVSHLPASFAVAALYSFLLWVVTFLFILLPPLWSSFLLLVAGALFFHIVIVFSAFGRIIMHTGAMGSERIFDAEFESELLPRGLHTSLLWEATENLKHGVSIMRQYNISPTRSPKSRSFMTEQDLEDYMDPQDDEPDFNNGADDSFLSEDASVLASKLSIRSTENVFGLGKQDSMNSIDKWLGSDVSKISTAADAVSLEGNNYLSKKVSSDSKKALSDSASLSSRRCSQTGTRLPPAAVLNAANHSQKSIRRIQVPVDSPTPKERNSSFSSFSIKSQTGPSEVDTVDDNDIDDDDGDGDDDIERQNISSDTSPSRLKEASPFPSAPPDSFSAQLGRVSEGSATNLFENVEDAVAKGQNLSRDQQVPLRHAPSAMKRPSLVKKQTSWARNLVSHSPEKDTERQTLLSFMPRPPSYTFGKGGRSTNGV